MTGESGAGGTPVSHTAAEDSLRWALLAGVWGMYAAFGLIVASLAPVLTPLSEDLGLSKSSLGAILGTWPAVFIFASVPAGWVLDRIGLRWALFAGGVLVCLSGVLRALASSGVTLFVAVGVFGLGAPMISNGAPKLVVSRFSEAERAKATGIYLTGPVAGQIIALAAANSVIRPAAGGSWRSVPLVLAALTGVICVLWLVLTARIDTTTPSGAGGRTGTAGTEGTARTGVAELARNPVMRLVLLMALAVFLRQPRAEQLAAKDHRGRRPVARDRRLPHRGVLCGRSGGLTHAAPAGNPASAGRPRDALALSGRDHRHAGAGVGLGGDTPPGPGGLPAVRPRGALPPDAHERARGGRAQHGRGQRPVLHGGRDRRILGTFRRGRHR